ncbi:MAG TPA: gamma-glutamylcyclotransferase, partial [Usitatibacter sp.]|nr:gamma-glutamylcyclotransferase [Usitatibacter sp.]
MARVFVFGTLKEGFPNFAVNQGARVPGRYRTRERFPLYLVGDRSVPWMLDARGEGEQVAGELYEVDEATLAAMDRLERVGEPDGYRRVAILVEGEGGSHEAHAYLKPSGQLASALACTGPLAEYTLEHARLYRPRPSVVRGVIFDLFHTLTARESEWSSHPATCDLLGVDRRAWDRVLIETSRWRLVGEERDPYTIFRRLVDEAGAGLPEARVREVLAIRTERFRDCFDNIPRANVAMLRRLREAGFKLALLSNADVMDIAAYGGSALEGLFDVEIFSCDAGCAKPEPAIYHACLRALGLEAADCIFVGDGGS